VTAMAQIVSHSLTVEDLGVAIWALDIAPRFGLVFHWSDGVKVRGWSVLAPNERTPFEACKPAIRALLTPDASGRAGLDYIRAFGPAPEEASLKPSLADKIAAAALDHRGDPATREIAWRKLHDGGALKPMEPRLPPPETAKPEPEPKAKPGPPPKPSKSPNSFSNWGNAWPHFRRKANWTVDEGRRTTIMWGFRRHRRLPRLRPSRHRALPRRSSLRGARDRGRRERLHCKERRSFIAGRSRAPGRRRRQLPSPRHGP